MNPYYKTDNSVLFCGDCEEAMSRMVDEGIKIDKVITSPPYNILRNQSDVKYDIYQDGVPNEEYIDWIIRIFALFDKLMNKDGCIIWNMSYGGENSELLPLCIAAIVRDTAFTLADILVWKKRSARPNNVSPNKMTRITEFVFVFSRRNEYTTFKTNKKKVGEMPNGQAVYENLYNFFEAANNDEATEINHATFSSEFVWNIIDRYVLPSDIVLDPFSGTGTTMVACEARNRKGYYVELSENQCDYSVKRMKGGVQMNLFDF